MDDKIANNMELMELWDYERNEILGIASESISYGSNKNVCWKCKNNHRTIQSPHIKSKGRGCAYCARQKLLPGENDLKTLFPDIAAQWDYKENYPLRPEFFFPTEKEMVWWKCSVCGNSWDDTIGHRTVEGRGCHYCSGQRVKQGYNDLKTLYPNIAKEWDVDRNLIHPEQVSIASNQFAWWKCNKGHRWNAQINSRTRGNGCPYCAGQKVLPGYNDLATRNEQLSAEWNYDKNDSLIPQMYTANSTEVVWWKCSLCYHEWISSIDNRMRDRGCPNCKNRHKTSFPEQAIFYYINKIYDDAKNKYTDIFDKQGMELDVFIPSTNVGIEYDGAFHMNENAYKRDHDKYLICKKYGIKLYRIRTFNDNKGNETCDSLILCNYDTHNYIELDFAIKSLLELMGCSIDVDTSRDKNEILSQYKKSYYNNSLIMKHPELAKEWHPSKNGKLLPEHFTSGSGEKVWWKCTKCGYEWEAVICSRVSGRGCSMCARGTLSKLKKKKVRNIDTGEVFDSVTEAGEAYSISRDHISLVCRGKKKSVKNTHWEFYDSNH